MSKRVHAHTVAAPSSAANPQTVAGIPNPWERLAMRKVLPSVFAQDQSFTRGKQVTNSSDKNVLDLGVLSPAGEKAYLQRVAMRKNSPVITKSEPGRIPNALRSVRPA